MGLRHPQRGLISSGRCGPLCSIILVALAEFLEVVTSHVMLTLRVLAVSVPLASVLLAYVCVCAGVVGQEVVGRDRGESRKGKRS